ALPFPRVLEAHRRFRRQRREQLGVLPRLATVRAHVHARDASAPAPGETANGLVAWTAHLLWIARTRDDRLRVHLQREDAGLVARKGIGVLRRLPASHEWIGAELDAAQPLHVGVAFEAGQEQANRKALFRTKRLAVLRPGDHRVVAPLAHRNAAREETR